MSWQKRQGRLQHWARGRVTPTTRGAWKGSPDSQWGKFAPRATVGHICIPGKVACTAGSTKVAKHKLYSDTGGEGRYPKERQSAQDSMHYGEAG